MTTVAVNEQMEQLNRAIALFPVVTPVLPSMHMEMKGVSRTVMLDRYAFKDVAKTTLIEGDLVVLTYKDHPKFPSRGYGIVTTYDRENGKVTVKLDSQFEGGAEIEVSISKVDKPLEIFYEQIAHRVARGLAEVETTQEEYEAAFNKFYFELVNLNFVPAGRVLMGAGSGQGVTYFNCYVMPFIHDSRGGIGEHRKQVMEIMSRGGGVGTNGSTLRPRNALCHGVNGRSSGSVTWLNDIANLTNLVQQGGSRRGAQMIMLADWHPDVVEFIISKIQNPRVLRFIIETTDSALIKQEAEAKLKFTPLSALEKRAYGALAYTGDEEAQAILKDGGIYSVNDPEFLTGANISVTLTHEFMAAVDSDGDFELRFPDVDGYDDEMMEVYDTEWQECGDVREWEKRGYATRVYHTIKAKQLWDLVNICATYSAEPGIFFIDNANDMTNAIAYGMKVVATNPCGEQPLAPYSVCNLAAVNLAEMATAEGTLDLAKLERTVKTGVHMQDNVISATPYFMEENTKQALGERRVGMGVMGLHDLLIKCGLVYGSPEGNEMVDDVFRHMSVWAYEASIELAKTKGSFPFLEILPNGEVNENGREKFINSGFMKKMPAHVREDILTYGIRNSHLLTVAPTGSTGTMVGVSTGLEPYFGFTYYRSGRLGKFIPVVADIAREWLEKAGFVVTEENAMELIAKLPKHFISAMELAPEAHADVQCIIQKHVDSSLSKTVNAPKGYTVRQVEAVYERLHKGGAKGGTVYVDGSRDAQVLSLTNEENDFSKIDVTLDAVFTESFGMPEETGKKLGTDIGDTCIICEQGEVVESGGCHTCNNCGAQLQCGL